MRYAKVATGMLLLSMMVSSCTCEKALPPAPTQPADGFSERGSGIAKKSPEKLAAYDCVLVATHHAAPDIARTCYIDEAVEAYREGAGGAAGGKIVIVFPH